MKRRSYIFWGSSGHAKVLASIIKMRGDELIALFDNDQDAITIDTNVNLHTGIDGFSRWIESFCNLPEIYGLAAIGGSRGFDRLGIHKLFHDHSIRVEKLIHPDASIYPSSYIGKGTQVLAMAVIGIDAIIGEGCIINHHANIDHECVLEDGVHVAPGATLCGCVSLLENAFIGAGATVLPRVTIGRNSIVGAGAVVTKNIPANVIVTGNPATIVRIIEPQTDS